MTKTRLLLGAIVALMAVAMIAVVLRTGVEVPVGPGGRDRVVLHGTDPWFLAVVRGVGAVLMVTAAGLAFRWRSRRM